MPTIRTAIRNLRTYTDAELATIRANATATTDDPECPPMTAAELAGPATIGRPRRHPNGTQTITARLDRDIIDWLKSTGPGYQTRINAILRNAMRHAAH